jgi:hypothetical protein
VRAICISVCMAHHGSKIRSCVPAGAREQCAPNTSAAWNELSHAPDERATPSISGVVTDHIADCTRNEVERQETMVGDRK